MDPGNYHFEPPAPPRRGVNPGIVAFAVVLLGALGVYLVVLLADSDDDDDTATTDASATPFAVGSSELPEPLVGQWEGTVSQDSSESSYDVDITLHLTDDDKVGEVSYPTLDCGGRYTLEEVTEDAVTLVEHITDGEDRCVDGVEIELRYVDADELSYSFDYEGNPDDGTAALVRTDSG